MFTFFLSVVKFWVSLFYWEGKETIKIHEGNKPATPLAGPFKTAAEAKKAKEEIIKKGEITTFWKKRRGNKKGAKLNRKKK